MNKLKNKNITLDDLGGMVGRGFSEVYERVGKGFDRVEKELAALKEEVLAIKADIESIKLRMGEMAFNFEIRSLEQRVKKVETKLGIK